MTNMSPELPTNNAAYLEDVEYSIQVNRWFLKPMGAWPMSASNSRADRVIAKALNFTCCSVIALTVIPSALYIIYEDEDFQTKLKAVGPISHWIMGGINYYSLLSRGVEIRQCIEDMEANWRNVKGTKDREVMLRNARFGRFMACFSAACMQIGTMSFTTITGISTVDVIIDNKTVPVHQSTCPFYNGVVDTRLSPYNEISVTIQIFSCFVVTSITAGACGLAAILAMHACGQLNVVMLWLDDFVRKDEKGPHLLQKKLAAIVEHHLRALSFISRIEEIMHQICLVELLGCTLNLCVLGYYCLTEWNEGRPIRLIIYIIILTSMTFNIFIFCYIGDVLAHQCKEVGQRAYMIEWYQLPHKTALSLILIISRSSAVIKITAGKMVQLSIPTFGDVMRTSVTYLNMLRTITM